MTSLSTRNRLPAIWSRWPRMRRRPGVTIRVVDYDHITALITSESGDEPGLRA